MAQGLVSQSLVSVSAFDGNRVREMKGATQESVSPNQASFSTGRRSSASLAKLKHSLKTFARERVPYAYDVNRGLQQYQFNQHCKTTTNKYDVYHEPNFMVYKSHLPTVVSIHDTSWIRNPEYHPESRVEILNRLVPKSIAQARKIITISDFVKREISELFPHAAHKVCVTLLAAESIFIPIDFDSNAAASAVLSAYGLKNKHYFMVVGTFEPRKNIKLAIQAFLSLPTNLQRECPLVLAGLNGWKNKGDLDTLATLQAKGLAKVLGYVPRSDLATITAGALAMVYPSVYEGFGLPPLEAMACGVPAVVVKTASLPEVVGDQGIFIDATDPSDLAQQMLRLYLDTHYRQLHSVQSLTQAGRFSWAQCAKDTHNVYQAALHG